MAEYESVHIETRDVGEMAREEVAAAREAGVNPLALARTHERVAAAIRNIVRWQDVAGHRARTLRAVDSQRSRRPESDEGESDQ